MLKLLLLLLSIQPLHAQPNIQWQNSLGGTEEDIAYAIKQTPDGGFAVAGQSRSSDGDSPTAFGWKDFWVTKLDPEGTLVWQNNYLLRYKYGTNGGWKHNHLLGRYAEFRLPVV